MTNIIYELVRTDRPGGPLAIIIPMTPERFAFIAARIRRLAKSK